MRNLSHAVHPGLGAGGFFDLLAFVDGTTVCVVLFDRLVAGIGAGLVHLGTRDARPLRALTTVIALNSNVFGFLALHPLVRGWGTFLRAAVVA